MFDILKIEKNCTECFIFQSKGAWSFVWVAKPTKLPPWRRDWISL